jgi:hypothetical protein
MVDTSDYCRELERYLCQKNGGHLIRIVGPAFETVRGWAESGVPLTVAYRGIDQYCTRQKAGAALRARPVRIEFCERDVLTLFDEWKRAVGVARTRSEAEGSQAARKAPLASHVERVVARLVGRRIPSSPALERHIEGLLIELDRLASESRQARGQVRAAIIERLAALDVELMVVAAADIDADAATRARREAETQLAPFGSRMAADERARALAAAYERAIREALNLPTICYD